ncbi:hypothetical protein PCASD_07828 [Puccinia coronata f. sp. avenae]|uniref:Uncharacterized protein n=1 Tax=Puccinia coronata f. sp. avenae TaxID=200324 RepID=A0A2N5UQS7_9BASI|nr:hypothetical protein PCASD_07828 [Puccinia coronata f. sp. avenae]
MEFQINKNSTEEAKSISILHCTRLTYTRFNRKIEDQDRTPTAAFGTIVEDWNEADPLTPQAQDHRFVKETSGSGGVRIKNHQVYHCEFVFV